MALATPVANPVPGQVVFVGAAASVQFAGGGFNFRVISVDPKPTYHGWCWLWGYVLKDGRAVDRRQIFVRVGGLAPAWKAWQEPPRSNSGEQRPAPMVTMRERNRMQGDEALNAALDAVLAEFEVDRPARIRAMFEELTASQYTLHITFTTSNAAMAARSAAEIAEGLGLLRADVDTYSVRLTSSSGETVAVFCPAAGPGGAFCGHRAGHDGWHEEPGVDGERWFDGDPIETAGR